MNHGADQASSANRRERYRFTIAAHYFLSRGYAFALPMMRGFAGSGGSLTHAGCDLDAIGISNVRDIRAFNGHTSLYTCRVFDVYGKRGGFYDLIVDRLRNGTKSISLLGLSTFRNWCSSTRASGKWLKAYFTIRGIKNSVSSVYP